MRGLIQCVLCLVLACFSLLGYAAIQTDLLADVRSRLGEAPVLRGEFVQTRQLAGIRKPLQSEGSFLVLRTHGVLWQTEKPFPQLLRVTEREIMQRDARGNITRLSADKEPVVATISTVLSGVMAGDFTQLSRLFTITGSVDGKRWQLVLVPRETSMAKVLSEIRVAGAAQVDKVSLQSPNGDSTQIEMRRMSSAITPSASDTAAFE